MHPAGKPRLVLSLAAAVMCWLVLVPMAFAGSPPPVPSLSSLSFAPNPIAANGATTGTVTLTGPAPPGDLSVSLSVNPASAATAPPVVTVPAGQSSAQFTATDLGTSSSWTVSASLFADTAYDTVFIATPASHVVVNEVDYDQPGTDAGEFVELFNPTASTVDLRNLALVFSGGAASSEYLRVPLQSLHCLPAGGYGVVADNGVNVPASAGVIRFAAASDNIRNAAHTGVTLVNLDGPQLIDSLWYGGTIGDTTNITGFSSPVSLIEGTPTTAVDSNSTGGSLSREPNGSDSDDAQSDWTFDSTPSPGSANAGVGSGPGLCPNAAPTLDPIGTKTIEAGHPLTFTVSGSDPDSADSALLAYSASNLPAGASFDPGTRQFSWTPTTGQVGTHPGAHFEVTDGMATDSEDVTITVTAPAPGSSSGSTSTPPQGAPAPPVVTATLPSTKLGKLRVNKRRHSVTLTFSADQPGATFVCSLDRKKFAPCRSPKTYRHLRRGRHTFRVKARGAAGMDPTPAVKKFRL